MLKDWLVGWEVVLVVGVECWLFGIVQWKLKQKN